MIYGPINRHKSKLNVAKPSFTHPHDMIFTDYDGKFFTFQPGTHFYDKVKIQHFNDEEGDPSKKYGEILQLGFAGMRLAEIEKEFGPMNHIEDYEEVVKRRFPSGEIPNVFDQEYKYRKAAPEIKGLIGKL